MSLEINTLNFHMWGESVFYAYQKVYVVLSFFLFYILKFVLHYIPFVFIHSVSFFGSLNWVAIFKVCCVYILCYECLAGILMTWEYCSFSAQIMCTCVILYSSDLMYLLWKSVILWRSLAVIITGNQHCTQFL